MAVCPICSNVHFKEFRGRAHAQCTHCKSLERHRFAFVIYRMHGVDGWADARCDGPFVLHLAPERFFYEYFSALINYTACDANPERYGFGKVEKLLLPEDFDKIQRGKYDFILHNHVMEHIPGHWYDHINSFVLALRVGGKMIFTIPKMLDKKPTREGGEHCASDELRKRLFGQEDHVRKFGFEFVEALKRLDSVGLDVIYPDEKDVDAYGLGELTDPVFVIKRMY